MTEEIAKTVSQLLKEKSELLDDLSKICDKPNEKLTGLDTFYDNYYYLSLCYGYSGGFIFGSNPSLNINRYKDVKEKVKELLISEINEKINKIDKELSELKCS